MKLMGVCVGKNYCFIAVLECNKSNYQLLLKHEISTPKIFLKNGKILDYFRSEIESFCQINSKLLQDVELAAWEIPVQRFNNDRKLAVRIEGVVLSELFKFNSYEAQQYLKTTIFSKNNLKTINFDDLDAVGLYFSESNEYIVKAISAALTLLTDKKKNV